jgi:hypothetical protein
VLLRAFAIVLIWTGLGVAGQVSATSEPAPSDASPNTPPPTVYNEYYPDERPLSDCLSSLPKPDCGSESRGDWRQISVLGAIVAALAFIAWRIVRSARHAA